MEFENIPKNKNIKTTIVNNRYVSSVEIWRSLPYAGGWVKSYETFVWEWDEDKKERGIWLYETYQNTEEECIRVHDNMVSNFSIVED